VFERADEDDRHVRRPAAPFRVVEFYGHYARQAKPLSSRCSSPPAVALTPTRDPIFTGESSASDQRGAEGEFAEHRAGGATHGPLVLLFGGPIA